MKIAIILGISEYDKYNNLDACKNDSELINDILTKIGSHKQILFINSDTNSHSIKSKITEFIENNKKNSIEELFFYYTGHGARYENDFFYLFKDFDEKRKETTGLRNTELDGLIRNLNPELTIKIIDACYSGTTYIKAEDDIESVLEKSAKKNELKKLYFFHSSDSEETSLASKYYSYFTLSFCISISKNKGKIRYRDIMAFIADDMGVKGYPKPQFIVQADNTEIFADIEKSLIDLITSKIKTNYKVTKEKKEEIPEIENIEKDLLTIIKERSDSDYCDKEEAFERIESVKTLLEDYNWTESITSLFDVKLELIDNELNIPNSNEIGRWLKNNSNIGIFSKTRFKTENYKTKEYKKIPKPPKNNTLAMFFSTSSLFPDDDYEYRLETVEKERQVIDGFYYTADTPIKVIQILFKPRFAALENYSLYIVILFSRKALIIFYAFEKLIYTNWDNIAKPNCYKWEIKELRLKAEYEIEDFIKNVIDEVSTNIISDIESSINKKNITKDLE